MLRTKSKSRLWALALVCLMAITALALGLTARAVPATAETTTPPTLSERETEWLKPYDFTNIDTSGDKVVLSRNCTDEYGNIKHDGIIMTDKGMGDPYSECIEFDIQFESICSGGFTVFADTQASSDPNYNKIGVRLMGDKAYFMSAWGKWTEQKYSGDKTLWVGESGYSNPVNKVFHMVFGVERGTNDANKIYFKMTEKENGVVWIDDTKNVEKDGAGWTECNPRILIGTPFDGVNKYKLFVEYESVDALDNDKDISYYWNRANNAPIELTYTDVYAEKLISDISMPANSAVTWKFSCNDNNFKMISFNMFNQFSANSYNFAVRPDNVVFTTRDGVNAAAGDYKGTSDHYGDQIVEFRIEKSFTFEKDTDYIMKFSEQDVRNADNEVVGRLLTFGIKQSDASEFVSAQAFTSWVSPDNDKIGVVLHADTAADRKVTVSSADSWYSIEYTDGVATTTQKAKGLASLRAPSRTDKIFVGWSDGTNLYKEGNVYVSNFMKLSAIYIDKLYAPNVANLNMVSAKLRFTGRVEATSDVWTKLNELTDKVKYVIKITPSGGATAETVKSYSELSGANTKIFTADTDTINSADYGKTYAAQVYLRVTYANNSVNDSANISGTADIESAAGGAKNSVNNVAGQALADTSKQWNTIERRKLEELASRAA